MNINKLKYHIIKIEIITFLATHECFQENTYEILKSNKKFFLTYFTIV